MGLHHPGPDRRGRGDALPDRLLGGDEPQQRQRDGRLKHGLGEALHTAAAQDAVNETYAPVVSAVEQLLRACGDSASLRPDLDAADVLLLMGFMWRVAPDAEGLAQAERLIELAIAGLRPTPGPAPSASAAAG
ncbi:hypothetical protein [Streptacidiphilus sp. BW17]|uniref:SbtR family transcriptional regulator n=1 Tax=Streptacidiphilus sp. BW17 TaxID=3156274 RepID=UPI00351875B8